MRPAAPAVAARAGRRRVTEFTGVMMVTVLRAWATRMARARQDRATVTVTSRSTKETFLSYGSNGSLAFLWKQWKPCQGFHCFHRKGKSLYYGPGGPGDQARRTMTTGDPGTLCQVRVTLRRRAAGFRLSLSCQPNTRFPNHLSL